MNLCDISLRGNIGRIVAGIATAIMIWAGPVAPAAAQDTAVQEDKETLRAAALLFRHGVISPKYAPPKNATEWPMGFSQLTAVGMRQMFDQGSRLRKRYVDELGFLTARYHRDETYVRASSTDRALQSAQMILLGLYPLGMGPDPAASMDLS